MPVGLSERLIITVTGSHAKVMVPVRTISRSEASFDRATSSGVSTCSSSTVPASACSCSIITANSDISTSPSGTGSTRRKSPRTSCSKGSWPSKCSAMAPPSLVAREERAQLVEATTTGRAHRGDPHAGGLGDVLVARAVGEGHDPHDLLATFGQRPHVAPQHPVALAQQERVLGTGLGARRAAVHLVLGQGLGPT